MWDQTRPQRQMEVSWIRERVWSTSSPVQFAGRLFFSEPQKPQEQIRVSIRNNGPSQKAAKMWHTHTLSHILHVVCAVIYFFFHSHTFTMCNSQHDKKKENLKAKTKSWVLLCSQLQQVERTVLTRPRQRGRGAP